MEKQTITQNAYAIVKVVEAIQKKYDLPEKEVIELASAVYKEHMQFNDNV